MPLVRGSTDKVEKITKVVTGADDGDRSTNRILGVNDSSLSTTPSTTIAAGEPP